jgi:hypothetical protein
MSRYWVEISELDHGHGGPGWELGTCLWSPTVDRGGADRYAIMRDPRPGDVVFHFITRNGERVLAGHSRVAGRAKMRTTAPPTPGRWANFEAYFRIPLQSFTPCANAPSLRQIEDFHAEAIRADIVPIRPEHHPYATYGDGIRIAQGAYLALLTNRMVEIFGAYISALPIEDGITDADVDIREYQEGEQLRRERVFFSRHPRLREDAVAHYGASCSVCKFDFEAVYGDLGRGFIEIHHLESVAERGQVTEGAWSASIHDVRPLCANCHRMVHRRRPPISVDELAKRLR